MTFRLLAIALATFLSFSATAKAYSATDDALYADFKTIPYDQRMAVYWYWISNNISVPGVINDLEAMHEKGITRAYIGNIWVDGIQAGDVKVFSDEWWDVIHAALKRASELNMEIGIFNCPGWSQSGGPWVNIQQSMRYLNHWDKKITGTGKTQTFELPAIGDTAKDVRILAVPDLSYMFRSVYAEMAKKPDETAESIIELNGKMTVRSIEIKVDTDFIADCRMEAMIGGKYETIKKVHFERSNGNLNVGFHPYGPMCFVLPDVKTDKMRITFEGSDFSKKIHITISDEPRVEEYDEKSLAKMFQSPLPMWDWYMWDTQKDPDKAGLIVSPNQIIDITDKMNVDGTLTWKAPKGKWIIMRTGMVTTGVTNSPAAPEATGLEIDKMSRKHVEGHFDAFIGELLRRIPAEDRTSFKVVVEDSYETGGLNWTDDMVESFMAHYGYDPTPYIPVLYGKVIGSQAISERFLWDLRRIVADRVAYDYVGGLRDISHQHGLTTWLECYGHWGFPSEFLMYGGQSDEVAGEFWSEGGLGDIENRAASSCAHIYGKQKVWAESCTAGGASFCRYPCVMKQRTDRFFTEGINATLLHVFIEQPDETNFPGVSAWFGNEFNRKNTWWEDIDLFTDYLRRCNLMLQKGRYVADVAYFIGEDAPKMTGAVNPALPRGYSFDYINAEILRQQARVENGRLKLNSGMEYDVLVLPDQTTMRPEVLRKIEELVEKGLTIAGPKPASSPSLQNYPYADEEVRSLADKMWASVDYGNGHVFPKGTDMKTILDGKKIVPDCYVEDKQPVKFIHRTLDDREVYFVSNQSEQDIHFDACFRVTGMKPNLWNPINGERRVLPEFKDDGRTTLVPLRLAPNESVFIVFDSDTAPVEGLNYPEPTVLAVINTPWSVEFHGNMRGPSEIQTFDTLQDWANSVNPAIRYYSGKAVYTNVIAVDEGYGESLCLSLGKVMVMAKVWVNDQYAGGVWTYPYEVNVSGLLHKGKNTIRVEVVNNWMNRLIGDQALPESERQTWTSVNPWHSTDTPQSSGLLGPVKLMSLSQNQRRR